MRRVGEQVLAEQQYVSPVDVLLGLGWLAPSHLYRWRQGRVLYLEQVIQANLGKVSTAMAAFRRWAQESGLTPSATAYLARTRDRRHLRFSASADPSIEQAYRTHWVSPKLSERKRKHLAEQQSRPPDLVVVAASNPWTCTQCRRECSAGALLLMEDPGPHWFSLFVESGISECVSARACAERDCEWGARASRRGFRCCAAPLPRLGSSLRPLSDLCPFRRGMPPGFEAAERPRLDDHSATRSPSVIRLCSGAPVNMGTNLADSRASRSWW